MRLPRRLARLVCWARREHLEIRARACTTCSTPIERAEAENVRWWAERT